MKPIAMKCSLEQWRKIEPKLKGFDAINVTLDFDKDNYLVNNFSKYLGRIGNIYKGAKNNHNRIVYEEWNEDIFLEACDIKPVVNGFTKGDYIVTLEGDFSLTDCAKENYCFKIKSSGLYMSVESTITSSIGDSNRTLTLDKSSKLKDWRYATPEEIAEYDRLGRPYDVTTLNKVKERSKQSSKFQLPEKWCCKLTVENAGRFEKAYNIIVDNSFSFTSYSCYYSNTKDVYREKPDNCVEITLEQMEKAACISDTINPDFNICNAPIYEFPRFKETTVPDDFTLAFELSLQATDKQLVNLTKPTLNRPKTKQLKTNLIKPIKPVKL